MGEVPTQSCPIHKNLGHDERRTLNPVLDFRRNPSQCPANLNGHCPIVGWNEAKSAWWVFGDGEAIRARHRKIVQKRMIFSLHPLQDKKVCLSIGVSRRWMNKSKFYQETYHGDACKL